MENGNGNVLFFCALSSVVVVLSPLGEVWHSLLSFYEDCVTWATIASAPRSANKLPLRASCAIRHDAGKGHA